MATFTAPSLRSSRRAASAWESPSTSPSSQGFSFSNWLPRPAAADSAARVAQGPLHHRPGPFPVKNGVGGRRRRVWNLDFLGGVRAGLKGDRRLPAAPLGRPGAIVLLGQVVLDRPQKVGAEVAPAWLRPAQTMVGDHLGKKALGQIACTLVIAGPTADKGQNRRVVGRAQLSEGGPGFRGIPARGQHLRPAGGDKGGRSAGWFLREGHDLVRGSQLRVSTSF